MMNIFRLPIVVCALITISPIPHAAAQTSQEGSGSSSRLERLVRELDDELTPYAEDRSLDSLAVENAGENDFDLVVLGDDNPVISDECYKLALRHAAEEMMLARPDLSPHEALRMGIHHIHERKENAAERPHTYGEFFQHVVQCDQWCKPLVVSLEKCHVEAISTLEPWAVFFDYNSDVVPSEASIMLDSVAEDIGKQPNPRVLLVGRASRAGNKMYNRLLSKRRTLAVEDRLLALGVEASQVRTLWFGWEPPQIGGEIAAAYGIGDVYAQRGELAVNQSVMIVIY